MAAELALKGYAVRLCELPEFAGRMQGVFDSRKIRLSGIGLQGWANLEKVTTQVSEAIAGVEFVHFVVPAFAQEAFFEAALPHFSDGQTAVVWAGDFGSLRLAHLVRTLRPRLQINIVEAHTLPYGTRLVEPGHVALLLTAPVVLASALPAAKNSEVIPALSACFPCVKPGGNAIAAALSNPNPIVHPPGSLLNVGRIQYTGGEFWMYREGITEAVARVIRDVYNELAQVAKAYQSEMLSFQDGDFRTTASIMGASFVAPFDTTGVIASVKGPTSIHHRYITEDLPYGLVPASQLARKAGLTTPLVDSIVHLGSSVCGMDFWKQGRTLETLGLASLSVEQIIDLVRGKGTAGSCC
jgi:opine dehydrogenase